MIRVALIIVGAWLPLVMMGQPAEVLSTQADTKDSDPASAAGHASETTAMWGFSNFLGGMRNFEAAEGPDAMIATRSYAKKTGNLFTAASVLAVREREDVVETLAKSSSPSDTRLAAAALASAAIGDYLQAEREANKVHVDHVDVEGNVIKIKKAKKGKGKGKGKGKNAKKAGGGGAFAKVRTEQLPRLLASKDSSTVFLALQAAAYAKDASVAEAITALQPKTSQIAGVKLLYRVMIGEKPGLDEIQLAAKQAGSGKPKTNRVASFSLDQHGLCFVCQAIGILGEAEAVPILNQALAYKDEQVQIDAARAMAKLVNAECLPALHKAVSTASWPVLIEVCNAVGATPSSKMVTVLIKRLSKEKGRMRLDLTHALSSIAGKQHGRDAKEWTAWWRKNHASFEVDMAQTGAYRKTVRVQDVDIPGIGFFYGLPIYSDKLCYVVDSSASMKGDRIASLKPNLTESIERTASYVAYSIVDFGGDVEIMYGRGLTTNKGLGKQRVYDMDLSVATRSFCALRQGAKIDKVDTLYFLSDGAPAMDSMKSWSDIVRGFLMLSRYRQIAVFCIDFDPSAGNLASMIQLADENVGLHESIEVGPAGDDVDLGGAAKKRKKKK